MDHIQQSDRDYAHVVEAVNGLLEFMPYRPFSLKLANGVTIGPQPAEQESRFTLVLNNPASLRRMFLPPSELAMGEGYIFDDYDIEGDIANAFEFIDELDWQRPSWLRVLGVARQLWQLERSEGPHAAAGQYDAYTPSGRLHSIDRDKQAVQFHYDVSNAFYKLWLDERLTYSSAYYRNGDETLGEAQLLKLDLLCRKLDLQAGESLWDIGCGWGSLIIHAVQNYGARATGITLSEAQAQEAEARIKAADIADRCHAEVRHYEQMETTEPFDKINSIGMFEHVGEEKLPAYFARAYRLLKPGGLFLLQGGIAGLERRHAGKGWMERLGRGRNAFMHKYSFPDSRLVAVPTLLGMAERAGFELLEATNMRLHAAQTARHWQQGLEQNEKAAVAEVGEAAYRCWRLIWAGYYHLLSKGSLSEYQFLFRKPASPG